MKSCLTLIIVVAVVTAGLQALVAGLAGPALLALTRPLPAEIRPAGAVARALLGAALERAVPAIPARHAEASAVLALPVHCTPIITSLMLTAGTSPAGLAHAHFVLTPDIVERVIFNGHFLN